MRLRRTLWKGRFIPFISFYITDDFGNEIKLELRHKSVCPIYHFLAQSAI